MKGTILLAEKNKATRCTHPLNYYLCHGHAMLQIGRVVVVASASLTMVSDSTMEHG